MNYFINSKKNYIYFNEIDTISKLLLIKDPIDLSKRVFSFIQNNLYTHKTKNEFIEDVRNLSFALLYKGINKNDKVFIIANSCYEFAITCFAVVSFGGIIVPIHPQIDDETLLYLIETINPSFVFVKDIEALKKVKKFSSKFKRNKGISLFSRAHYITNVGTFDKFYQNVIFFYDFILLGNRHHENNLENFTGLINKVKKGDPLAIVLSSGVSGFPKLVNITQGGVLDKIKLNLNTLKLKTRNIFISLVPISRIEFIIDFYMHFAISNHSYFLSDNAKIYSEFKTIKPTIISAFPQFYRKLHNDLDKEINSLNFILRGISRLRIKKEKIKFGIFSAFQYLFIDLFITTMLKRKLGLTRTRFLVSYSALISMKYLYFYNSLDLTLYDFYSITECLGVVGYKKIHNNKLMENLVEGNEIKIEKEEEIKIKSKTLFSGYYNNLPMTMSVLENEWFKTEDYYIQDSQGVSEIEHNTMRLTLKDGNIVSARKIKNLIDENPYIKNILIFGSYKPYLVGLIELNLKEIKAFAKAKNIFYLTQEDLFDNIMIKTLISEQISNINSNLLPHEAIMKYKILKGDLSHANGELTIDGKIRQYYCEKIYKDEIDKLYL